MRALPTSLDGVLLLEPAVHGDDRGFFVETFRANVWGELGIDVEFVQDNHSRSRRGVVRGMHVSVGRGAAKLVRCGRGAIHDVLVDVRRGSPTFGQWEGFDLSDANMHLLYAPVGFAHGFCVLSDTADVLYKQDAYYEPDIDRAFKYDDPDVGIEWPLAASELVPSQRDLEAPLLRDVADGLPFEYR
jgi:dTDP-4-dehydrorhamnose 3,5-epimerase